MFLDLTFYARLERNPRPVAYMYSFKVDALFATDCSVLEGYTEQLEKSPSAIHQEYNLDVHIHWRILNSFTPLSRTT